MAAQPITQPKLYDYNIQPYPLSGWRVSLDLYLPHSQTQSLGFAKLTERGTRGPAIFERREADSPAGHEGTRRADLPRTMLAVALLPGEGTGDGDALPRCFLRGACLTWPIK